MKSAKTAKANEPCTDCKNWFHSLPKTKWMLAIFVQISGLVLAWIGKLSGSEFVTLSVAVIGAYIAGNVAQKFAAPESSD